MNLTKKCYGIWIELNFFPIEQGLKPLFLYSVNFNELSCPLAFYGLLTIFRSVINVCISKVILTIYWGLLIERTKFFKSCFFQRADKKATGCGVSKSDCGIAQCTIYLYFMFIVFGNQFLTIFYFYLR